MGLSLPTEVNLQRATILVTAASAIPLFLLISPRLRTRIHKILKSFKEKKKLYALLSQQSKSDESTNINSSSSKIQVSSLFVHPIKSLRPVSVQSSPLTHLGLAGDRTLMLVRPSASTNQYRFMTQRQCPKLATLNVSLPTVTGSKTVIKISNSDETKFVLVDVSPHAIQSNPVRFEAGLWSEQVQVVDLGDEPSKFLQSIIKDDEDDYADVRVVAQLPNDGRRVDERYCPDSAVDNLGRVPKVSLTDGFPILIASEESLEELNRRLREKGKDEIPMSRFRPNIVVKGLDKAFGEDEWKAIQIGEGSGATILHVVKGCPRCKQSCTDQVTGERFEEPLETLRDFRALDEKGEEVYFAQNALLQPMGGVGKEIRVGDVVRVLTKGDPVWDIDTVAAE